jgi:hypothetical protein
VRQYLDAHLHPDWELILKKARSIRWMAAAFVFTVLEAVFAYYGAPFGIPKGLFAVLSGITTAFAFYSRMKAQKEFENANK